LKSAGNLTGDVAEHLTAFALGGTLTASNEKGCDVIEPENIRIEVKSCTKKKGRSLTTGAIRDLDAKTFDFMVVVEFDESHNVLSAWKIPHSVVNKFAGKLQVSTNSKKITVKQAVKEAAGVEEITHLYK
jgi:hypothetical protein